LEVGHKITRVVPMFDNPGPKGAALSISAKPELIEEVYDSLARKGWGQSD
jgi:3-hydroxybutyrate dehydrogenase